MIKETFFGNLKYVYEHGGAKQCMHYLGLKARKMIGFNTFRVNQSIICTKNGLITIGNEYQYREGSTLERVRIENIDFKKFFIYVNLHFIDQDRKVECCHLFANILYSGMWRLWDKDYYNIEEWRKKHNKPVNQELLDSIPIIYLP